jgi:hypothetical protein
MTDLFCDIHNTFKEIVDDNPNWLICNKCEWDYLSKERDYDGREFEE